MSTSSSSSSGGISFCGLLTIVFIVLKVLDKIDWPWLWVLAPLWIPLALVILVMIIMLLVYAVAAIAVCYQERKHQ